MLFDQIILTCSLHIEEERSTSGIFHLLTGKRAIQTVHDAHLYDLENYYGVHPRLNKQLFDRRIADLIRRKLLIPTSESNCKPSMSATHWLEKEAAASLGYFRGLKYYESGPVFLQRLLLLIQTLTNSRMKHFSFIPVIDNTDITAWVKKFYKQIKTIERDVLPFLYQELYILLDKCSEKEAALFVSRLSGYKHYGKSIAQLAGLYKMDENDVVLFLTGVTHKLFAEITAAKEKFPFLASVVNDLPDRSGITQSAQKTQQLIMQNYTISEVATLRSLKQNTIHDHIVEIALHDQMFPIDHYIDHQQYQMILDAAEQTNSHKLKTIKEHVNEDISYFQIRLTLTNAKIRQK